MDKKLYIKNLDLEITERCTLKCKHCFNCMQYYTNPKDIPLETIMWEMESLTSIVDKIDEIRVLGGEPFMNKQLSSIIDFLYELPADFKNGIRVFTNATILPTEGQLNTFVKTNTRFYISDYGLNKKQRVSEFCDLLEKWGIEFGVYKLPFWYDPGAIACNNKNIENLKSAYSNCWGRDCITLLDGKLYQCEIVANANRLKLIPDFPEDYVDLREGNNLYEKVDSFLNKMEYMKSCQYCNLTYNKVTAGIQIK